MATKYPRRIRSFVRREGRITPAQERALDRLWPRFGIPFTHEPLDLETLFGRSAAERVLEIGFGDGETLVREAADHRDTDYLGVEVHRPGIGHCLLAAEAAELHNLRLVAHDAVEVLERQVPAASLGRINIYFPDPWPKKRHHKRRLIQPGFLELAGSRLCPAGSLRLATDWPEYAEHIDAAVADAGAFNVAERREHDGDRPLERPTTRFERRGLTRGHRIVDWRLELRGS